MSFGSNKPQAVTINGADYPIKAGGLKISRETIDGEAAGRNQHGDMIRAIIAVKTKVEIEFAPLTQAEASAILALGDMEKVQVSGVCIPTSDTGFYAGNRSIGIAFHNGSEYVFDGCSLHLIEI